MNARESMDSIIQKCKENINEFLSKRDTEGAYKCVDDAYAKYDDLKWQFTGSKPITYNSTLNDFSKEITDWKKDHQKEIRISEIKKAIALKESELLALQKELESALSA